MGAGCWWHDRQPGAMACCRGLHAMHERPFAYHIPDGLLSTTPDSCDAGWGRKRPGCGKTFEISVRSAGGPAFLKAHPAGAHGDTLSIMWATMNGLPLGQHRQYGQQTGELRRLQ